MQLVMCLSFTSSAGTTSYPVMQATQWAVSRRGSPSLLLSEALCHRSSECPCADSHGHERSVMGFHKLGLSMHVHTFEVQHSALW